MRIDVDDEGKTMMERDGMDVDMRKWEFTDDICLVFCPAN